MKVQYSVDTHRAVDEPVHAAARELDGKPIRVRVQPQLLRKPDPAKTTALVSWPQVSWSIECAGPDEVIALREAMREFFAALERAGVEQVKTQLQAA